MGYIRAKVNNLDPLDIDSDREEPEEDDMPPSSFVPPGVDAPRELGWEPPLSTNATNPDPQPWQQPTHTANAQDRFEQNIQGPLTLPEPTLKASPSLLNFWFIPQSA